MRDRPFPSHEAGARVVAVLPRSTTSEAMMNTLRSKDGTTIAFDRSGDGPAVIVVSGALSTRSTEASVAAQLAGRLSVITYDRRGRGDSSDGATYAVAREVEELEALIEQA